MLDILQGKAKRRMVAAFANDAHTICAAYSAIKIGIIEATLVGDENIIKSICEKHDVPISAFRIVHEPNDVKAANKAVALINQGEGDFLMKGLISSDKYMRAILNKETGLINPGAVLSHVTVIEAPAYSKLLIVGDVAIIPQPDLNQKIAIANYLIKTAHSLGIEKPKLGIQSASEMTMPKLSSSADAAIISKMAQRGQIQGAIVDGPLGLDIMIDPESAEIKGVKSEIKGDTDCILFPNIEAGNTFYKTMTKLGGAELGALVMGARVPAVLSSRGDSELTKLYSIALAALGCN